MKYLAAFFFVCLLCLGATASECAKAYAAEDAPGNATGDVKADLGKSEAPKGATYKMEELLVVAPPVIEGNQVNRLGSQVTTVTEQQIEDLNAQDFASALRKTPGVVVSRHNPVGSFGGGEGGAIFIRGKGISRPGAEIQILVDGIPKFVGIWTHPIMDMFSVDIVEQMEVYKGAQPVLFGNMAMGAVDITTKRMREEGFRSSISAAGGSFGTVAEVAEHGGKTGLFDYYLIQSYRRSDGNRANAGGELQNYFGRLGYQISPNWRADLVFNRTDNWASDPGSADGTIPPDGTFKTHDYFTVATVSNKFERMDGYIKVYNDKGHIDWVNQFNGGLRNGSTITDWNNYGVRARETFRPWEGGEFMVGADFDFISGEVDFSPPNPPTHFDNTTFRLISPYVAVSQLFGSKDRAYLIPSAGIRYISHNQFADEPGPQAGLILGYKNTELHVSYARGINYPGIFAKVQDQLFMPGPDNRWESLTAELVDHFEAGISHKINDFAKMDLTFFRDDGKDRIVVATPPPFPPVWTNVGSFKQQGVEASVTVTPMRDLAFFAGATYLESDPADLPYAPSWSAGFGLNYRFLKRFQLSVDTAFVDKHFVFSRGRQTTALSVDRVDAYCLLNAKLTYDLTLPCRYARAQLFIAGENLTDTDYEQKKGYPMAGLNGMGGIKVWF